MKYIIISLLVLITACNETKTGSDMEGVYTANFEHEFGKNEDTLIVKKINDKGIYQISRHTGLVRKIDSKEFSKEIKMETWTLEFDPARQTLTELREGKLLIWSNTTHSIRMGKREYKKIKGS